MALLRRLRETALKRIEQPPGGGFVTAENPPIDGERPAARIVRDAAGSVFHISLSGWGRLMTKAAAPGSAASRVEANSVSRP